MRGGEIYEEDSIDESSRYRVCDSSSSADSNDRDQASEKLHEQMIGIEDAPHTYAYDGYFKILPAINDWFKDAERIGLGEMVPADFSYTSDNNEEWMTKEQLKTWIAENAAKKLNDLTC